MKIATILLPLALLAGCTQPSIDADKSAAAPVASVPPPASAPAAPAAMPADAPPAGKSPVASARGKVEAVDAAARTVTIAHGPVAAFGWPAMTMTFKAPEVDLAAVHAGDTVDFQFTARGMDATISTLSKP